MGAKETQTVKSSHKIAFSIGSNGINAMMLALL